jgi:hypothetical protein
MDRCALEQLAGSSPAILASQLISRFAVERAGMYKIPAHLQESQTHRAAPASTCLRSLPLRATHNPTALWTSQPSHHRKVSSHFDEQSVLVVEHTRFFISFPSAFCASRALGWFTPHPHDGCLRRRPKNALHLCEAPATCRTDRIQICRSR